MEMKERKEAERRNQEDEDVEEWYSNYEVLLRGGCRGVEGGEEERHEATILHALKGTSVLKTAGTLM